MLDLAVTHLNASLGPVLSSTQLATALRAVSIGTLSGHQKPRRQHICSSNSNQIWVLDARTKLEQTFATLIRYTKSCLKTHCRVCWTGKQGTACQKAALVELLVNPRKEAHEERFRLCLPARELGLPRQAVVANLLLNLVQSGDRVQYLVGLRQLDIPGVKDFTACVRPALRMCDPHHIRVMFLGAVDVALQDGVIRPLQTQDGFNVLCRPARVV